MEKVRLGLEIPSLSVEVSESDSESASKLEPVWPRTRNRSRKNLLRSLRLEIGTRKLGLGKLWSELVPHWVLGPKN